MFARDKCPRERAGIDVNKEQFLIQSRNGHGDRPAAPRTDFDSKFFAVVMPADPPRQ
jgi:hypothetical protein